MPWPQHVTLSKGSLCLSGSRIYCLFRAPRAEKSDDEAELDTSDAKVARQNGLGLEDCRSVPAVQELSASGVRLITMSLSIMQSFNGIGRIDLEWPAPCLRCHLFPVQAFAATFLEHLVACFFRHVLSRFVRFVRLNVAIQG